MMMVRLRRLGRGALRVGKASFGAVQVMRHGVGVKHAFDALALAVSPHTAGNDHASGLEYEQALRIVLRAHQHGLDFFDLWLVFDGYVCDDLDEAVNKLLELHATYDAPVPRS
jgi:hypothetical protein